IISSHQDKNPSRSSFIPNLIDYGITFFDLRNPEKKEEFVNNYKKYNIIPLTFSDAHEISKIGKYYMTLDLANNSYNEFKKYFLSGTSNFNVSINSNSR
ncbi:hypothetical protein HY745_01030, partial [Candidatus Desantisbacteria bacterium]|nr:hypothetical protein [Candidatus Desantisbacteria bacterium]